KIPPLSFKESCHFHHQSYGNLDLPRIVETVAGSSPLLSDPIAPGIRPDELRKHLARNIVSLPREVRPRSAASRAGAAVLIDLVRHHGSCLTWPCDASCQTRWIGVSIHACSRGSGHGENSWIWWIPEKRRIWYRIVTDHFAN